MKLPIDIFIEIIQKYTDSETLVKLIKTSKLLKVLSLQHINKQVGSDDYKVLFPDKDIVDIFVSITDSTCITCGYNGSGYMNNKVMSYFGYNWFLCVRCCRETDLFIGRSTAIVKYKCIKGIKLNEILKHLQSCPLRALNIALSRSKVYLRFHIEREIAKELNKKHSGTECFLLYKDIPIILKEEEEKQLESQRKKEEKDKLKEEKELLKDQRYQEVVEFFNDQEPEVFDDIIKSEEQVKKYIDTGIPKLIKRRNQIFNKIKEVYHERNGIYFRKRTLDKALFDCYFDYPSIREFINHEYHSYIYDVNDKYSIEEIVELIKLRWKQYTDGTSTMRSRRLELIDELKKNKIEEKLSWKICQDYLKYNDKTIQEVVDKLSSITKT